MSRYRWPNDARSEDRPRRRMRYNASTNGVLLTDAMIAAHELRAVVAEPVDLLTGQPIPEGAPSGDENLWVPIGPSTVIHGQAGSRPRVSGRVRDLAVSDNGQRAYAATANGGVWYTSDGGSNWSPLGNWVPTPSAPPINRSAHPLSCGCLLVEFGAAADGSADDVYVGTGELIPDESGMLGDELGGIGVLHLDKPLPQALADPFGKHWKREAKNLTGAGIFRLARDPGNPNTLLAATSIGLFKRTGVFVEDADWNRVVADPFNFTAASRKLTSDVVWAKTSPARLFVALQAGNDTAVYHSTNGVDGPYQKMNLPGAIRNGRLGFAVAPTDQTMVYVLGKGPRLWRITGFTPEVVKNIPPHLFTSGGDDQSHYDLAIAVNPNDKDVIAIGGAAVRADEQASASLFRCTMVQDASGLSAGFLAANQDRAKHADDPTFIGNGVHADVHQIRFIKVGGDVHVWVGCDGGVFRSRRAGDKHSFTASNAGLAVLETGYLASHPDNDAFVIAGTQDNGALLRVGDTVWARPDGVGGDAGCVLIHPVQKRYFAAQNTGAKWKTNGTLSPPVFRTTKSTPPTAIEERQASSENAENTAASFYSSGDLRKVGAANQVRLAIGTNRVWLADNWDPLAVSTAWVTLPSNNDPRRAGGTDVKTDRYGDGTGEIIACRWLDDKRLLVLMRSAHPEGDDTAVLMMNLKPDGKWERKEISHHHNKCFDYSNGDIPQPTSGYLPPLGAWSDLAIHDPTRPPNGSFYVACTGHVRIDGNNVIESDRMDTLWWYDGNGKWHPTGLRTANSPPNNVGTKAPAYAVICDPADDSVVYVGTALGVWRGVLTLNGANPSWAWKIFSNGLPEAAVQDLSFHRNGTVKLLRAAIQSRGVWEVDLAVLPGPTRRTFLRVHANDSRRSETTSLVNPMLIGPDIWPWHASPDIRLRPAPLGSGETAPAAPSSLPWTGSAPNRHQLWIFQTALHNLDPLCRPTGKWTEQFTSRLTADTIDAAAWNATVVAANVFAPPWDGDEPTEADLFELIVEDGQRSNPAFGPPEISRVKPRKYKVDVLAHHRDLRPLAAGDVRLTLLSLRLPDDQDLWPAIAISAQWKTRVAELMSGAPPAGWSLPDSWIAADSVSRTRQPASVVDARTPRAVTFDIDFSGIPDGDYFVLLGVVHSTPDPVSTASLDGATLQELILKSHHVAARVVEIRR